MMMDVTDVPVFFFFCLAFFSPLTMPEKHGTQRTLSDYDDGTTINPPSKQHAIDDV